MTPGLEAALDYAARGWRVVPIRARQKVPAVKRWQDVATVDVEQIERWWARTDYGVGIATGQESGLWVLDVDIHSGGLDSLRELVEEQGALPKGPRVDTGTLGFHLYFANPAGLAVATRKSIYGSGLDVRGDGGQVLAPPTGHPWDQCKLCLDPEVECPSADYVWHPGRDGRTALPEAPGWLLELVEIAEPPAAPEPPLRLPTQPGTSAAAEIADAHDWHQLLLGDGWTLAGTASNGDTEWTRPGKDKRLGVSAILHEPDGPFVNYSTNAQGLCQSWARAATGDGWAYSIFGYVAATRHGGDRSAAARTWRAERTEDSVRDWARTTTYQHPPPTPPVGPPDSREGHGDTSLDLSWAHLIDWPEFWKQDHSAEQWVCWPLVPAGRSVALFAPAKAGKSTVALAAVAAVAAGRKVLNAWTTHPRHVLYLDYEMTEADIWERLHDLGYGEEVDLSHLHYAMLPSIFPLDTDRGAAQIVALARSVEAELVVIDTFSRAVQGDENDADTSRDFYRYTGMALKSEGMAVLRTDHAGKAVEQGQRGSSAKNDDVDVVWGLERTDQGVRLNRTHSRVTWVPEQVEIDQVEHDDGTTVYAMATRRQWPVGTEELAGVMDRIGIPLGASGREAARILREAGEGARNDRIRAAQQWREVHAVDGWTS